MRDARLPFDVDAEAPDARIDARDRDGRARAVDPRFNVALEASAGTGKTRILVDRYVNLLRAGVDPSNILAMTFTRKAAAEMRERILLALRSAAARGEIAPARWRELRDRTGDVEIGTIDAFCLSLLREFPLEADLDPAFTVADDSEVPRLAAEALDRALAACRALAPDDEHVALVLARLGDRRLRAGLAALLSRRIVAPVLLRRLLGRTPADLTVARAAARAVDAVMGVLGSMSGEMVRLKPDPTTEGLTPDPTTEPGSTTDAADGLQTFAATGPADPAFMILVGHLESLVNTWRSGAAQDPAFVRTALARLAACFLTREGAPRKRLSHAKALFPSPRHWARHRDLVVDCAPQIAGILAAYRRDLHALLARGVWRMFRIAEAEYRRTLDAHAMLDFADLLLKTRQMLGQMEEFARSRYRLEARYHHVLVDEFQDTSRAQWELVSLLVQSWGEGAGLADSAPLPPSIFIVGDSKQSIYGFRDADASVLADAGRYLEGLRPDGDVRRSISRSFRSVPALLSFVNDVCRDIEKAPARADAFRYDERHWFPVDADAASPAGALGAVLADEPLAAADGVAAEIHRLIASGATVRDAATGVSRPVVARDIAILFRTRETHRAIEEALVRRGVPAYVYKGLGFFESDEIRDVLATLWHLAAPASNLRAAAWLRSGFVRLTDEGLRRLAPGLAEAIAAPDAGAMQLLEDPDAEALGMARAASSRWRALVDRLPPAELLDLVLSESAYALEMRGPRFRQARENVKKLRDLTRRIQDAGFATLPRVVAHLDRLALGDESNAAIDARGAVSLMTVHAAKGLEFPVVFVVNLATGTGGRQPPIRLAERPDGEPSLSLGDFDPGLDEDEAAKEREETKRLLYVALTRARDRLYLSAVTSNGRLRPGRGSLAEVLPASLLAALDSAGAADSVRWMASSGAVHAVQSCRAPSEPPGWAPSSHEPALEAEDSAVETDFTPLSGNGGHQMSNPGQAPPLAERLLHRVLERFGLPDGSAEVWPSEADIERLVEPEEGNDTEDITQVAADVSSAYRVLETQPRLEADVFYNVPVSWVSGESLVRTTIGCLLRESRLDGGEPANERLTVLEFRTGRLQPEHVEQTRWSRLAVERAFPGASVAAFLVSRDGVQPVS